MSVIKDGALRSYIYLYCLGASVSDICEPDPAIFAKILPLIATVSVFCLKSVNGIQAVT